MAISKAKLKSGKTKAAKAPAAKTSPAAKRAKPLARAAAAPAKSRPGAQRPKAAAKTASKTTARTAAGKAAPARPSGKAPSKPATKPAPKAQAGKAVAAPRSAAGSRGAKPAPKAQAGTARPAPARPAPAKGAKPRGTARPGAAPPTDGRGAPPAASSHLPHIEGRILKQIVAKLSEMRAESQGIVNQHLQSDMKPREESSDVGDDLDQASHERDREFNLIMHQRHLRRLRQVQEAFERISDGSYGLCEGTDEPINPKRLLIMPLARYSLEFQEQQEKTLGRTLEPESYVETEESFSAED
jgi:DnaK suppressor protein